MRLNRRVRKGAGPAGLLAQVASYLMPARPDEAEVLLGGDGVPPHVGGDGVRPPGQNREKDIFSDAVVLAAFAPDDATAAQSTGLSALCVHRAQIVCCEALSQLQEGRLREIMGGLDGGFLVVKRSSDETPFNMAMGPSDPVVVSKFLNQRCFLRWSPTCATRVIFPAIELEDESAAGLVEAFERASPALNIDGMRAAAARVDLCAQVHLGDSLAANAAAVGAWARAVPQVLHWKQRCDVHACQLITMRSLDTRGLFDAMFCLHKLLRHRATRDRLQQRMVQMAVEEVNSGGTSVLVRPPEDTAASRTTVLQESLFLMLQMCDAHLDFDVWPQLRKFKDSVRQGVPLLEQMFNGAWREARVRHYCCLPDGGRCCHGHAAVAENVTKVVKVVLCGLLFAACPEPTKTKWFSCAMCLRSVLLGVCCHGLLRRAWLKEFASEHSAALEAAEQDRAATTSAETSDYKLARRARHLKVAALLNQRDLPDVLLTVCVAIGPVERLQLSLCKHDCVGKLPSREQARAAPATVSNQSLPATVSRHDTAAPVSGERQLATVSLPGVLDVLAAEEAATVDVQPPQPWNEAPWPEGRRPALEVSSNDAGGVRQRVQRSLAALLQDFPSSAPASLKRALILQQSADFWLRFECYYDKYPQCLLQTLSMSSADRSRWWRNFFDQTRTPPCCLDPHFSRKLQQRGLASTPVHRGSPLWEVLQSIARDDSCTTTIENERQHGRMASVTRRHAQKRKGVQRLAAEGLLAEWLVEHRRRGFSTLAREDVQERFRKFVRASSARARSSQKQDRTTRPGSAKMRFINAQDSVDSKVAGRKRTRQEMVANRRRLAALWDSMPEDHPTKRSSLEEFRDGVEASRLARLVKPRDGVQGQSATVSTSIHEVVPGSAHGVGSAKTPLAGAVLEAWRGRQRTRGLRQTAQESTANGFLSGCSKCSARPRDGLVFGRGSGPCPEKFLPGLCRTLHGQRAVAVAVDLKRRLWGWVTSRWRRMDQEGALVARFTVAEGGKDKSEFLVLSRRRGNPRQTVWTQLEASCDDIGLPCQLQIVLRDGRFAHEADAALCHRLSGAGAAHVTVAEVLTTDGADALASVLASGIVQGSQQDLWPPPEMPARPPRRPMSLLELLTEAERPPRDGRRETSQAPRRTEVERDPELVSGSDASVGDWSAGSDESDAASAGHHAPVTRRAADGQERRCPSGSQVRRCPSGSQMRRCPSGSNAPAAASGDAAGSAEGRRRVASGPLGRERQEAIGRVLGIVREVRAEADFRETAPRAVVAEALNRLDSAGQRFWGVAGLYSRRRTVLDACLASWPPDLQ